MSVHERSEPTNVLHQVCQVFRCVCNGLGGLTRVCRQVADLERQLLHTKQELYCLRAMFPGISAGDTENSNIEAQRPFPQEAVAPGSFGTRSFSSDEPTSVVLQMQLHGRGLFGSSKPSPSQESASWPSYDVPELPPIHTSDCLLKSYRTQFHPSFPIIDWPSFIREYDEVYRIGSLRGSPRGWITSFFAVLACGSLHAAEQDLASMSKKYIQTCTGLFDFYADEISADQVRTTFLLSVYLFEINRKTAAWTWLSVSKASASELKPSGDFNNVSMEVKTKTNIMAVMSTFERFVTLSQI